jgi:hypothetical protein
VANDMKVKKVPVLLDKERHLVFDLNAICELEDKFGSVKKAFDEMSKGSMKVMRTFLWAGLIHDDENLTEKQVGALIGMSNIQEISKKVEEAVSESLPEAKN